MKADRGGDVLYDGSIPIAGDLAGRSMMAAWDIWFAQICRDPSLVGLSAYHDRINAWVLVWQ